MCRSSARSWILPVFDVSLERSELFVPVSVELVEPGLQVVDPFGSEAEDACPRVVGRAFVSDDSVLEQNPKVAAHDGRGRADCCCQLTGSTRLVTQELDDLPPRRIGQRAEQ